MCALKGGEKEAYTTNETGKLVQDKIIKTFSLHSGTFPISLGKEEPSTNVQCRNGFFIFEIYQDTLRAVCRRAWKESD